MYPASMDPTAVQGKRIGAWLIDFVFAGVLTAMAFMIFVDGVSDIPGNLCSDDSPFCSANLVGVDGYAIYDESTDTSIFIESDGLIWPVVAFFGYGLMSFVLIEGLAGGSLGKLILGLRVVRADGGRAGIGYALLRFVLWAVDGAPWCFPLVGLIMGLTTTGHRRLGDIVAGTFVVGVRDAGRPVLVPGLTSTPGAGGPPFATPPAQQPGTPFPGHRYPQEPYTGPAPHPDQTWPGSPANTVTGPGQHWPAPDAPADTATGESSPTTSPADHDLAETRTGARHDPVWDPERNTYVQWDAPRQLWLIWDTGAEEWKPLS